MQCHGDTSILNSDLASSDIDLKHLVHAERIDGKGWESLILSWMLSWIVFSSSKCAASWNDLVMTFVPTVMVVTCKTGKILIGKCY